MDIQNIKSIYFLGIGGIGMSALARYFNALEVRVSGYDKTPTALTEQLQGEGIEIIFEDDINLIPKEVDAVVYTPAIPKDHKGLNFYKDNNYTLLKRSEVLGIISKAHYTIAVAGSHGKTTVSSMISHILAHAGYEMKAFLGGIATNYNSNYIDSTEYHPNAKPLETGGGKAHVVVIEADEFDRSFHRLHPDMAVITAVDTDHLDIYGTKEAIDEAFLEFTNKISEEGFLVMKQDQSINDSLPVLDKAFYALNNENADVYCSKYWVVEGGYLFHVSYFGKELKSFRINIGGFHNIENAIAAITIAKELKITDAEIKSALASFRGIKRRFEFLLQTDDHVFIDDYAHHPEEIRVFLESVREIYPDKKITAIFQPHLFTRTRDLAEGFAKSLSIADDVIILDIYPARELPVEGVTSALISDKLTSVSSSNILKEELLATLAQRDLEVVCTIGAGDIDKLLTPIKELLSK
jgi:UDP-N-acetylmuramate--alanine ligase